MAPEKWNRLPDFFNREKLVAAHRGFRACYLENTWIAFKTCPGRCDLIETDVQLSKDSIPVIIHDPTVTSPPPFPLFTNEVRGLTYNQRVSLNLGSWLDKQDPFDTLTHFLRETSSKTP